MSETIGKTPYKGQANAPKILFMSLRKLMNELLLVSPLVFILCITVQARTRVDNFTPQQYSAVLNQRIVAYVEPVRMVEAILSHGKANADPTQVRKIAEVWRDLGARGVLKPLPPEAPNDSTQDGIKGQIRRASDELAACLQQLARKEIQHGQYERAAQDAVLGIEVTQVLKYSDLNSIGLISVRQAASMSLLERIAAKLSSGVRADISSRIERVSRTEKPMVEAVLAAQRTMRVADPERKDENKELVRLMLDMAEAIDDRATPEVMEQYQKRLSELIGKATDESILPDFRFAWNAKRNSLAGWQKLNDTLAVERA